VVRVIAGSARRRRLVAPAGTSARPTTDRVKESVFAALGDARLNGAVVLDLYAGSGALAIEALSRGAARAVLVDRDRTAIEAIEHNLDATGLAERARVQQGRADAFLRRLPAEAPFDLVFLDPPYEQAPTDLDAVLADLARPGWLAPGATVVVERAAHGADRLAWPEWWATTWERGYGDTLVNVATAEDQTAEE
jgi:16S rRNA (guanine966-N2)-methyltransferase